MRGSLFFGAFLKARFSGRKLLPDGRSRRRAREGERGSVIRDSNGRGAYRQWPSVQYHPRRW